MESKKEVMHTPEPWFLGSEGNIWRRPEKDLYQFGGGVAGDNPIATTHRGWYGDGTEGYPYEANARRIVACVNACAGIDTEWLENNGAYAVPVPSLRTLLNQRDELLAALKNVVRWDDMNTGYEPSISGFQCAIDEAKSVIAKAVKP